MMEQVLAPGVEHGEKTGEPGARNCLPGSEGGAKLSFVPTPIQSNSIEKIVQTVSRTLLLPKQPEVRFNLTNAIH